MADTIRYHFSVDIRIPFDMPVRERIKLSNERRAALKAAGFSPTTTFPEEREAEARALAVKITEATGIEMEVRKGSYLRF